MERVLISKDVANQRWSIMRELETGKITGNVFVTDGGAPLFLYCEQTGEGADSYDPLLGADSCSAMACPTFEFIADVTLPKSFFAVPGGG